jgi:mono/diheme cytochrome c family protein
MTGRGLLGKTPRSAGWGVARSFGMSRIARTSARSCAAAYRLSAPHPAFGRLSRFAEKGSAQSLPRTGLSIPLLFALGPLAAALLVTTAAAQEPAATLSSGRAFAEQGGAAIYANVCAACHQPDAKGAAGAGAYPALAGSTHLASADYVLRVVIRGQREMPSLGGMMSDEQVADVVNYVRSHFGNDYRDRVSAAIVHAARPPSPNH